MRSWENVDKMNCTASLPCGLLLVTTVGALVAASCQGSVATVRSELPENDSGQPAGRAPSHFPGNHKLLGFPQVTVEWNLWSRLANGAGYR